MSNEFVIQESETIDRGVEAIDSEEQLIRLLCSPLYYNKKLNLVNPDAFDLRVFKNSGKLEEYVSLVRPRCLKSEDDITTSLACLGNKIWNEKKDEENTYSGYGTFICKDAQNVNATIEINPLKGKNKTHIGLFYKHPKGGFYQGPLPKTKEFLEILSDLAALLSVELLH